MELFSSSDIKVHIYFSFGKNKLHCLLFWKVGHGPRMNMVKMQTSFRETRLDFSGSKNFYLEK